MAENISSDLGSDIPENEKNNSSLQIEADAFLNAIASGADEDQADEAAFFAANPNGVVVDDNGEVLETGANSKIKKGEKVEFIDDDTASEVEKEMPPRNKSGVTEVGHDNLQETASDNAAITAEASEVESNDEIA